MTLLSACAACVLVSLAYPVAECPNDSHIGDPVIYHGVLYKIAPYSDLERLTKISEELVLLRQNPDQVKVRGQVLSAQWNFGSYNGVWWSYTDCTRGRFFLESVALRIDLDPSTESICRVFNLSGVSKVIRPSVLSNRAESEREWVTCEEWIKEASAGRNAFEKSPPDSGKIPKQEKYVLPAINFQPIQQQVPYPSVEEETPY